MFVLFIIGTFLAFFLAFLILIKKDKEISDKLLLSWLIVIGLQIFGYYTYSLGNWHDHPHTIGIVHPFPLAHGPFLYLVVAFSIKYKERFVWKDWLHFAPVLLMYVYMLPFFFGHSGSEKIIMNGQEAMADSIFIRFSRLLYVVSGFSYLAVSFSLLKKKVPSIIGLKKNDDIVFQYYIVYGVGTIFMILAVVYLFQRIGVIPGNINVEYIIYSVAVFCLFGISVYIVKDTGYLSNLEGNNDIGNNFYIDEEELNLYVDILGKVMNSQKPFLDPDLNAEKLSEICCIPKKKLLGIIKKTGFNSFADFINFYRIEEFKRKVGEPYYEKFDIFSIAYDSGFRVRSTFYHNFKKLTGETPTKFITQRDKNNNMPQKFNF
jgi:AraC-like DNA-binding protein